LPCCAQIIFSDSICVNCGEEGDVRLMGEFCHMEVSQDRRMLGKVIITTYIVE
jgi:hypothetical protein